MAEIGIKELKATASHVIDSVEAGAHYVITKRGRATAVIMPIEEAEDLVLSNASEFIRMRRQGRTDYQNDKTTSLKDLD